MEQNQYFGGWLSFFYALSWTANYIFISNTKDVYRLIIVEANKDANVVIKFWDPQQI